MIWCDPAAAMGGMDFAAADGNGQEIVARRRISVTADPAVLIGDVTHFEPATNALLATRDGYLAAWVELRRADSTRRAGASSIVRLVRLDRAGARLGAPVPLRAVQDSIDEVEPALVPFGGAVAVLWGHGNHIYTCAGCVPDHRIDLMLIDPSTLTPVSNIVSVTNGGERKAGGLLRRSVAVVGSTLLVSYLLTGHIFTAAGSAAFSCTM